MDYAGKDKIPVNYGMNALATFSKECGISMNDVFSLDMDKMTLMDMLSLIWAGVVDGARKEGVDCRFETKEDFIDYTDEEPGVIGEMITMFANQQRGKAEGGKKK